MNYFDASGAKPDLVRNVVMADGGGSSTTVKLANKTQIRVGVGQYANRVTNRERILLDNPEEAAQLSYSKKQHAQLKVGRTIASDGYICTAVNDISIETPDLTGGGETFSFKSGNGEEVSIFGDWYYRWETNRANPFDTTKHLHIYRKKARVDYSWNLTKHKPHHENKTPKGPLNGKVNEAVKEETGFDYNREREEYYGRTNKKIVYDGNSIAYAFIYPDGKTIYRKNRPFFDGINAMERIYYKGSNVEMGDCVILQSDQMPLVFIPSLYGPTPNFNLGFDFVLNPAF